MTAVILQARIDSKRLPKKAILDLGGESVIFRVMQALKQIPADTHILACPDDSVESFSSITEKAGFKIHSGPKEDVLERYCQVIRRFGINRVIRATGDNPFVFIDAAIQINKEAILHKADYAGYLELPYGAGVESVSAAALQRAAKEGATGFDREHVCPFLYNNPLKFKIYRPVAPDKWRKPELRLTIDTKEDYESSVKLFNKLKDKPNRFNGDVIISCGEVK